MALRFFRNLMSALTLFVIVGMIDEIQLSAAEPVQEYVTYVLTTDFDLKPILEQFARLGQRLAEWDYGLVMERLPRITLGR